MHKIDHVRLYDCAIVVYYNYNQQLLIIISAWVNCKKLYSLTGWYTIVQYYA